MPTTSKLFPDEHNIYVWVDIQRMMRESDSPFQFPMYRWRDA